ncbi:hypothetical protein HKCCE3408_02780 [Rhodobacterales bacterium HKCCE3408]|nr:hypothetical protein [Rhodobacterales bacterium HKCCE3408]
MMRDPFRPAGMAQSGPALIQWAWNAIHSADAAILKAQRISKSCATAVTETGEDERDV